MFSNLKRSDIINIAVALTLIIGIPITGFLLRQQQILKSRAAIIPIEFRGPNVKLIGGKQVAVDEKIQLQVVSPLEAVSATSAPTAAPTAAPTSNPNPPTPAPANTPTWIDVSLAGNISGTQTITVNQRVQEFREPGDYTLSGSIQNGSISAHKYNLNDDTFLGVVAAGGGTFNIRPNERSFIVIRAHDEHATWSGASLTKLGSGNLLRSEMQNSGSPGLIVAQNTQEFQTPGTYQISGNVSGDGAILIHEYDLNAGTNKRIVAERPEFTIGSGKRFFVILRTFGRTSATATFTNVSLRKQQ